MSTETADLYITIVGHIWTKYRYLQAAATRKMIKTIRKRYAHLRPRSTESHGLVSEREISDCKSEYKYKFVLKF